MSLSEHVYCIAITSKMSEESNKSASNFVLSLNIPWGNYSDDSEGHSCGQLVIGSFITTMCWLTHLVSCRVFWWNIKSPRWLSPDLAPCDFWHFPKLKSPLKGKRFQIIDKIPENIKGQLRVIRRTVWGPKVPTLKATEASLTYVQCFLRLVSSSINVSIFHTYGWILSEQTSIY